VIAETDTLGNVQAWYIYGLGLAYKLMPDGNIYTYHFDSRGSTIAMTDGTGQIVNEYSYGPNGERTGIVEATPNPFGYIGRYGVMEEGNGLKFMRARYYDDGSGRFLNKDLIPGDIRTPQSLNRYAYAQNNPVNWIDPLGLQEEEDEREMEELVRDPIAEAAAYELRQEIYKIDPGWGEIRTPDSKDDWNEVEFLREQLNGLKAESESRVCGRTPAGRPLDPHYEFTTGPSRNIPGSVVDETIDNNPGVEAEGNKTVYCDPINNVTVVTGNNDVIVSVHKGPPRSGQY
jgi:RHS repeat-associated protein